jgi:cytoskeletal protein CcmA (bactofilin family)
MRQTSDSEPETATHRPTPSAPAPPQAPRRQPERSGGAVIGESIQIKGTLSGKEDLTVDGLVDGKIRLKDHALTVGSSGRVKGHVHAKAVSINGSVEGNVSAEDSIEIGPSGTLRGDIRAPRVAIADGASFNGSVDMSPESGKSKVKDAADAFKTQDKTARSA